MATSFSASAYVAALQTLMNRQGVAITIRGFAPGDVVDKLKDGPFGELMIESLATSPSGALRELDGTLSAGLLVVRRLDVDEAEAAAFELALDVATALVDEVELDEQPVMAGGPILVSDIEPMELDGSLEHRVVAYLIRYEQQIRVQRLNRIPEPARPNGIRIARAPSVGPEHIDEYRRIVPPEEL